MEQTLLTIDVGNTSTAAALFSGSKIAFRNRMPTPGAFDETVIGGLLKKRGVGRIANAIISSVVPRVDASLGKSIRSFLGHDPQFVTHKMDLGFSLKIDNPRELGADRIAGCAGGLTLCRPPFLVIDSGTATTFDLVNDRREYIGGSILPGLEISLRALADHAARLKKITFRIPESPVGKNTADHIRAGIYYGFLGTVNYLIAEYRKILGVRTRVIATGGLSRYFKDRIPGIDRYEPDLLFYGLKSLAERNT